MIDKLTTHLKSVLLRACNLAQESGADSVLPDHLLYAVATEKGSLGAEIISRAKIPVRRLEFLNNNKQTSANEDKNFIPHLSPMVRKAIEHAVLTAHLYNHRHVGTEHLLSGLIQADETVIKKMSSSKSQNVKFIKDHVNMVLESTAKFGELLNKDELERLSASSRSLGNILKNSQIPKEAIDPRGLERLEPPGDAGRGGERETQVGAKNTRKIRDRRLASKTPALDFFTSDLTNAKNFKRIDPLIGREKELERVVHILCRRIKNNPLLLGDPGVGKTAIVEGLARRMVQKNVPPILFGKRILALDLPLLVAGTIYRGEFEGRLKQIIDEVKNDPNIILFIDEVHAISGAGAASGSLDAANILKPALARGEIRCIGATTLAEYKKHLETDGAIERRFQPVAIAEPSPAETLQILEGVKERYETHHGARFAPETLPLAVTLAERYLPEKFFPDKALDLIDEAAARSQVRRSEKQNEKEIAELKNHLEEMGRQKYEAILAENFSLALECKSKEAGLRRELVAQKNNAPRAAGDSIVTREDIFSVASGMTGIPEAHLLSANNQSFEEICAEFNQKIIGQEEAIKTVASFIRRAQAGLTPPGRPLASFLFLGPTGVGKTELAKTIAKVMFRDPAAIVRLDMSEFTESFQMSKLIGAPAGYVGFREQNKLTDALRRRPYSVVLFDEIEKAHPDILNLLLQILDDGQVTDSTGRLINFKNTFVIMTSNVGAEFIRRGALGFGSGLGAQDDLEKSIAQTAKDLFRPELLNRIDAMIVFKSLNEDIIGRIVDLRFGEIVLRLKKEKGISLEIKKRAREWLAKKSFDPSFGARGVRKILEREIETKIADILSDGMRQEQKSYIIDIRDGELKVHPNLEA